MRRCVTTCLWVCASDGNHTDLNEILGNATNTTSYGANSDNQLTSATATRQGLTVTGSVEPGPRNNKWYASTAAARGQQSAVSSQNGTFAIPGVPVTGGANALTVTVTDVSGNIVTQVVNVTVISGQPVSIGYDANGNQTTHNGWAMTYDRENRLASASSASLAVSYHYDALGRLIERIAGNSTNRLYYAGWQLIAEYDGAGTLQRKYVYGPGIDEPIRMTSLQSPITDHYFHCDGLGSVTEITDSTGSLVESYRYDVYGEPTIYNSAGVVLGTSALGNRLLFTGRDRDPATGWYNYRHRYYNPALGRFVQPDPIGIKGGDVNLYRYCGNNPVTLVDSFGLCDQRTWWDSYRQNYNTTLNSLYGVDLEWADTLGWWGLGSLAVEGGLSAYQSFVEYLAAEQIANARIAGALGGGSIWQRMANATAGAETARRTAALRTGMQAISRATAVVGAGATGYSIGARVNTATRAMYQTWQQGRPAR